MTSKNALTNLGVAVSIAFTGLKLWAGTVSGSVAVLSDALNSFLDVFSYLAIAVSVRLQKAGPDEGHQFGHGRAEPLAGFVIAILAAILGFTIVKDAALGLYDRSPVEFGPVAFWVLIAAIIVKIGLASAYRIVGRAAKSQALLAAAIDSRNDVLASSVALVGFWAGGIWDSVAGIAIGLWILASGLSLGLENSGYLMGRTPGREFIAEMRKAALETPGVVGVNDIRAHFLGSMIHAEIHIEVSEELNVKAAHDIGTAVRDRLLLMPDVDGVFVHVDIEGDPVRLPWLSVPEP